MELSTKKSKSKHKISISSISTIDSNPTLPSRISLRILSNAISKQIQQFFRFKKKDFSLEKIPESSNQSHNHNKQTRNTIEDPDFWLHLLKKMSLRIGEIRNHLDFSYILYKRSLLSLLKNGKKVEPKNLLFIYVACFSISFKYLEDDLCCNQELSRLFYISTRTLLEYEIEVVLEILNGEIEISWEDLTYEIGVLRMLFC